MSKTTVSILSAGYLGERLAKALESNKCEVKLAYRNNPPKVQLSSVKTYFFNAAEGLLDYEKGLFNSDVLVICLPPGFKKGLGVFYATHIKGILKEADSAGVKHVIFTSSVGIYPEEGIFHETSDFELASDKANALYDAEQSVFESGAKYKQVLRLAGLFGENRLPGNFKIRLNGINSGLPVNMVEIEDVVAAIITLIQSPPSGDCVFNLVAPHHPSKGSFYRFARGQEQMSELTGTKSQEGKLVDGSRIESKTEFRYFHRDLFQAVRKLKN